MNKIKLFSFFLIGIAILQTSCNDSSNDETKGNWVETIPYKGYERSSAVQFTIDDVTYIGLGYDGDDYLDDFYYYNNEDGYWREVASFPGALRESAVVFVIGSKAYIGLGYNRDLLTEELSDFWEFNPDSENPWTQLSDFGGGVRYNAVAFSINGTGYVGTGYDGGNTLGDFWKYNVADDSWEEIQSFPGRKREDALAFVVGNSAYVCTGRNNGVYNTDLVRFDAATESWTKITPDDEESYFDDFSAAVKRHNAVAVVSNDRVFLGTGISSVGSASGQMYEFYPATGEWVERTTFEGSARTEAVAFSADGHIFLGLGTNGSRRFDDFWEFFPDEDYDSDPDN